MTDTNKTKIFIEGKPLTNIKQFDDYVKEIENKENFESVYVEWQGRKGVVPDEILVRKLKQLHDTEIKELQAEIQILRK